MITKLLTFMSEANRWYYISICIENMFPIKLYLFHLHETSYFNIYNYLLEVCFLLYNACNPHFVISINLK